MVHNDNNNPLANFSMINASRDKADSTSHTHTHRPTHYVKCCRPAGRVADVSEMAQQSCHAHTSAIWNVCVCTVLGGGHLFTINTQLAVSANQQRAPHNSVKRLVVLDSLERESIILISPDGMYEHSCETIYRYQDLYDTRTNIHKRTNPNARIRGQERNDVYN